ncbi:MAG: hypothetical protein U5L72_14845 [Bacteroidales bacterium]|nr:hypothetical protein [Bacteroidales bacterium]
MKKGFLALLVSVLVLAATALWVFNVEKPIAATEIVTFGVIAVLVGFGLYFAFGYFTSANRGEPQEDELSKKLMQKTAAWSYYISLFMWVLMIMAQGPRHHGYRRGAWCWYPFHGCNLLCMLDCN